MFLCNSDASTLEIHEKSQEREALLRKLISESRSTHTRSSSFHKETQFPKAMRKRVIILHF